ncbi:hypothetical protein AWV79_30770 [Cupriavidus sp. UYMMa02A]|nr:hypothetical protein AWV79_30770 [Cupriavidus sp. UYMMa02A]
MESTVLLRRFPEPTRHAVDVLHAHAQHGIGTLRRDLDVRLAGLLASTRGDDVAVAAQGVLARLGQGQAGFGRRRHAGPVGRQRLAGAMGQRGCQACHDRKTAAAVALET